MTIINKAFRMISAISLCFIPFALMAHETEHKKQVNQKSITHWAAPEKEGQRQNPITASESSVLIGQRLFTKNCADCHGLNADGKGPMETAMDPPPTNLRAMSGHHTDGDLAWKINNGRGEMPAWKDSFSKEQVWHLVNFIQNLKKSNKE